jgi:hypothetical protein
VKDLPPTEMDNQQIADFMHSCGFGFLMPSFVPKEYMTEQDLAELAWGVSGRTSSEAPTTEGSGR